MQPDNQIIRKTNTLAILSLIFSLTSFCCLGPVGSITGIITGHIALSQIKKSPEDGYGLALAGLIIGYVTLALGLLYIFSIFVLAIISELNSPAIVN